MNGEGGAGEGAGGAARARWWARAGGRAATENSEEATEVALGKLILSD